MDPSRPDDPAPPARSPSRRRLGVAQQVPQLVQPAAGQHGAAGQGGARAIADAFCGQEEEIEDLAQDRLYLFDPASCPKELKGLIGGKIKEPLITANWPDILRSAATMATGAMPPSQLLRKFAAYPRQHELAVALREIGRVERTLFIIDWLLDADMQRRAQIGLNKGEAHHALKNALRIGRQGEIRDRSAEGQHFRMAGLNLLAAIIIYWNTKHLGHAVASRRCAGLDCSPDLLAHISPLGWAHILLTGEYRWPKRA